MDTTRAGRLERLLRLLERPRALVGIALIAALLALPTIGIGFYTDDYAHLAILEGDAPGSSASRFDLYRFIGADRAELHTLVTRGPLPWWSDPNLKIHFFRPLTSALIAMDHALFGRVAEGHHATSILLYALLVAAVGLFFRRVTPGSGAIAGLATLIFALDGSHSHAAAWSAGRHLLVAPALVALALAAHLRWQRDGWKPGAWLGPLGLALALSAGEVAVGGVAYWAAYAVFGPAPRGDGSRVWLRARGLLPAIAILAVYAAFYKASGYGASGSGEYVDMATDPVGFLATLSVRLPVLIADAITRLPAETVFILPRAVPIALGVISAALVYALYRAARPAIPEEERAALRWIVPGALASLVLAAGGFLGSRLLMLPGMGAAFLFAVLVVRGAERVRALSPGVGRAALRAGIAMTILVHLVLSPMWLVLNGLSTGKISQAGLEAARNAEMPGMAGGRIVIVAASDPSLSFYTPMIRIHELTATRSSWQVLSAAKRDHRVTRTGPGSLRIDVIGGRLLDGAFERVFRGSRPFQVGDRVELEGASVTVLTVDRGAPTALEARFDVPLSDPRLYLLAWQGGRLSRIRLPGEGQSIELPWSPGPFGFF